MVNISRLNELHKIKFCPNCGRSAWIANELFCKEHKIYVFENKQQCTHAAPRVQGMRKEKLINKGE